MSAAAEDDTSAAIAREFVRARQAGTALSGFPGSPPADLVQGYRNQDAAIALWPDRIVGWKVGYIAAPRRDASQDERLLGPVFAAALWHAKEMQEVQFPVFAGGFAAVEAEYVLRLAADAPAGKSDWSVDEAAALVGAMHIAVETAGSPLATINVLGPAVVVSDFGNNAGLILGNAIDDWHLRANASLTCSTWIDDACVGRGGAATLEQGPLGALAFALSRSARRGRPLRRGDLITTGAATGIHDIVAGQRARIVFDGIGEIRCRAIEHRNEAGTC